jgi:multidrug efflux pump subunit AcrA (membrane-fusion protein)
MRTVQQGDQVFPGMPFMRIVDLRSMQVEAAVSQADASEFRVGQRATVGLDAFPGLQFSGKIYSIGAMAVKGVWDTYYIRNVPVRIAVEGSDRRLIPDLSAWAHVQLDRSEKATIVPAAAVRTEGGRTTVFVKQGQGFEKRVVETGLRTATRVAVLSGLKPGEEVAVGPVN